MPTEFIYPENIRTDGETQPRAKINEHVCDEYGERMKAGQKFPAIDVFFDGENYWLADGFHRLQAWVVTMPAQAIECNVYQGTLADAQWYSYSVNQKHGLRRMKEDKERVVRAALAHPEAADMSNRQIAEHCGVSEFTVRKYRESPTAITSQSSDGNTATAIESQSESMETPQPRPRKGRDGRTINTANIGEKQRRKAKPHSPAEFAEARRSGYRGHPPTMVKLELPNNHVTNCAFDLLRYFKFEYLQKVFAEIVRIHQEPQSKERNS